jgi:hypothetical protein
MFFFQIYGIFTMIFNVFEIIIILYRRTFGKIPQQLIIDENSVNAQYYLDNDESSDNLSDHDTSSDSDDDQGNDPNYSPNYKLNYKLRKRN